MGRKNNRRNKRKRVTSTREKLRIIDVGGDGDCFWRVISHQIYKKPSLFMDIKTKVGNFILSRYDKYKDYFESEDEFKSFVVSIKTKGEWCEGEIEMNAVSQVYNVNLNILDDDGITTLIKTNDSDRTLNLYHEKDFHFKSMV